MNKSGHHLAAEVFELAKKLKKQGGNGRFELTFRWTAGHVGILGNQDADKEAKLAARGEQSEKSDLPLCLRKQLGHSLHQQDDILLAEQELVPPSTHYYS